MSVPARDTRTYAIPFERVWQAAGFLASGGLKRWHLVSGDDIEGIIKAESRTLFTGSLSDVVIRVSLDENAQTQVEATSQPRQGGPDLGANARRVQRFFRALEHRLGGADLATRKR